MLIFDAHLDLAMNAIEWNRDLTQPLDTIRASETHLNDKLDRARGTVCLPEMRKGHIGMCVATLIARVEHNAYSPVQGWRSQAQAWAMTQAQLAWYQAMHEVGEMRIIQSQSDMAESAAAWSHVDQNQNDVEPTPLGCVLSLEGADALVTLDHLHRLYKRGLRVVGPAHYGPGVYAMGTSAEGGFPECGLALLREMDQLGMILDITHLSDDCFWQALDLYEGPIWASHHNCRELVPHQRQLADEQIRALLQRDAVIGAALDAWMLTPGWVRGESTPESTGVTLQNVADHIDHICQLAGNCDHCGIGSDLDGAYGYEQTPADLNSIADLTKFPQLLQHRGYAEDDIDKIMHGNFVRFLQHSLPQ